ncbi:MAG: hypothetical protein CMD27_01650 [Flavobacteriales bacterium]|nr:hypothetical protein [Flavobacteriales bacterium]|tara:strand:- start:720 stop:3086 length:2367 start_codon:yes stop_codon:yes gene_type:complete
MKNQYNIPALIILLLLSCFSYSQNSGDFVKAMKAFDNLEFGKAETIFKRAYSRSNDRTEKNQISFKLAQCYFFLGDYKKAESNFRRTLKMRHDNPQVHYYLAECYKGMEKFDKAQEQYAIFLSLKPSDAKGLHAMESLRLAQEWIIEDSKYRVLNAGKINSPGNDFAPALRPKAKKGQPKLFFTSSREGVLGKNQNHQTGQPFSDIFMVCERVEDRKNKRKKKPSSEIAPPEWDIEGNNFDGEGIPLTNLQNGLEGLVNLKNSEEGVVAFNSKGNKMYFTRATFAKNQYQGRKIFSVELKSGEFDEQEAIMEEIPVDSINQKGVKELVDVHGPTLSSDGKTLFFSAEMAGGFGGSDIYVTRYDRRKKSWGKPENLGENINSAGNEGFAHYNSKTKNLYFSSDGRLGMGGLDIFKAEHNPSSDGSVNKMFKEAENLKYPVNTCYDDFGIVFEHVPSEYEQELKGYFSSNRVGSKWKSKGNTDIYYFDKKQTFFSLKGKVVDVADGSPISRARVELIGPSGSKIVLTKPNGEFIFGDENFDDNNDYRLVVNEEWFFQVVDTTITTRNLSNKDLKTITEKDTIHGSFPERIGHLAFDMTRSPIEMRTMRRPLVLNSVLFDLGKSDLREESMEELDSLASLLNNDWPNVVVELRSHTDFRGSDTLNTRLSYDRALSCVNYLVSKGVDSRRLIAVGMADTEPTVLDEAKFGLPKGELNRDYIIGLKQKKLQELAHQKNRRTDFKILSDDFKDWLNKNPNIGKNNNAVKDASIDKDGKVVPMKKSTGNFIQQLN